MQKKQSKTNPITLFVSGIFGIVVLNVLFIIFAQSEAKTVALLKKEHTSLTQENKIITSANEIYESYGSEIDMISNVFPSEETISEFIAQLENIIRSGADEYTFRFTAQNPIKEGDKLFLPMAITMKTDLERLSLFLERLEKLPYMTHITFLQAKTPNGFINPSEVQIGVKIYVQNPFKAQ